MSKTKYLEAYIKNRRTVCKFQLQIFADQNALVKDYNAVKILYITFEEKR